jgi:hypothetical protein
MTFVAINVATMFAVFYTWAVLARRTAPETHKRLVVMATLVLLSAAGCGEAACIARTSPASACSPHGSSP